MVLPANGAKGLGKMHGGADDEASKEALREFPSPMAW